MEQSLWGNKIRQLFEQSSFSSLEKIADALADFEIVKDSSDLSRWQKGERVPPTFDKHFELVKALAKVGIIKYPIDAQELTEAANFRRFSAEELTEIFNEADTHANDHNRHQSRTSRYPVDLEVPDGAVRPKSRFYVERNEDRFVKDSLLNGQTTGVTITIKGPRFVGKSSLLMRLDYEAAELNKHVVIINCHDFERAVLQNIDTFLEQFCTLVSDELGLENLTRTYWERPSGSIARCKRYMSHHILNQLDKPLVLALDSVDTIFAANFRDDFFSMLRSWSDLRAQYSQPIWRKLSIILVTSTEPYQFIKDVGISPFNVGLLVELTDFTEIQVIDLNQRYGGPLSEAEARALWALVGGHPYLVRQALYWVVSKEIDFEEIINRSLDDTGPFGPHLQRHLRRLLRDEEQCRALMQVIEDNKLQDESIFLRLQGAGLVKLGDSRQSVLPRCQLYANYFGERLRG